MQNIVQIIKKYPNFQIWDMILIDMVRIRKPILADFIEVS